MKNELKKEKKKTIVKKKESQNSLLVNKHWMDKIYMHNRRAKYIGETTLLVLEVYLVCVISPSSLKWAQLVP